MNRFCRELLYGPVSLIEVRDRPPGGLWELELVSIALVVAEIWGEDSPPQCNLRFF